MKMGCVFVTDQLTNRPTLHQHFSKVLHLLLNSSRAFSKSSWRVFIRILAYHHNNVFRGWISHVNLWENPRNCVLLVIISY